MQVARHTTDKIEEVYELKQGKYNLGDSYHKALNRIQDLQKLDHINDLKYIYIIPYH